MKNRVVRAFVGLTLLVAAVALSPAPAFAVPTPVSGPWLIEGEASGKCLDVPGSTTEQVAIEIYTCGNPRRMNQQWWLEYTETAGYDYYQIRGQETGMCLNVWDARTDNNISVIQYPCQYNRENDQWALVLHLGGTRNWYDVVNRKSQMCLTVANLGESNGSKLVQFRCNGGGNQSWTWYK
jgi:endo-1,4-beta-xylanase